MTTAMEEVQVVQRGRTGRTSTGGDTGMCRMSLTAKCLVPREHVGRDVQSRCGARFLACVGQEWRLMCRHLHESGSSVFRRKLEPKAS